MLYIVHLEPGVGADISAVQTALNAADDWYRLGAKQWCWVIDTNESAAFWSQTLQRFAKPGGELFICRLDPADRNGWKSKSFWEWFRSCAPRR